MDAVKAIEMVEEMADAAWSGEESAKPQRREPTNPVRAMELVAEIADMALSEEEGEKARTTEGRILDFYIRKARQLVR